MSSMGGFRHWKLLREILPVPTKVIFEVHGGLRRAGSSILVQMQTGKIALPTYLSTIRRWRGDALEREPPRPMRMRTQPAERKLQHCPRYGNFRREILGLVRPPGITWERSLCEEGSRDDAANRAPWSIQEPEGHPQGYPDLLKLACGYRALTF